MSPEVCENKPYTFKSDVWGLDPVEGLLQAMVGMTMPFASHEY